MRPNVLRELIRAGKPTLGTHLHIGWPSITELVGRSEQFDYIEFVGEYAPYDLHSLENIGRAIDLSPHLTGMMKIEQQPRTYLAVRAIGSGIPNLLFADVRTVEDAIECVRSVRAETPEQGGIHGVGMRRQSGFGTEPLPDWVQSLEDSVIALMIEKKQAVENLDAVLSVKGIDMVQFGPSDYSMSIGLPGQYSHPRVREAETYVIETALKKGLRPRAEIGSPDQAERYLKMGVKDFCIGTDTMILYQWFKSNGAGMRDLLKGV
jgi:4-hydroxy-2-oxoheptanedioate aldolase